MLTKGQKYNRSRQLLLSIPDRSVTHPSNIPDCNMMESAFDLLLTPVRENFYTSLGGYKKIGIECVFLLTQAVAVLLSQEQELVEYRQGHQGGGVHNSFQYSL